MNDDERWLFLASNQFKAHNRLSRPWRRDQNSALFILKVLQGFRLMREEFICRDQIDRIEFLSLIMDLELDFIFIQKLSESIQETSRNHD